MQNSLLNLSCANARFLALMNVSSLYWSPLNANECVFSCNEQQKVYLTKTKEFVYQIPSVVSFSSISQNLDPQNKGRMDVLQEVIELVSFDMK